MINYITIKVKLLLLAALLMPTLVFAQAVKGRVVDANTGLPLANVNVYFDGTFQGTATDSAGNFALNNAIKTSSPLVVSYMGYQSRKITSYGTESLNIALKLKVVELKEVIIGSDEISRAKAMKIFLKEFIGESAQDCSIDNPDELYFHYFKKKDLLTADADKPLIITNKLLGYKITYFLTSFSHAPLQTKYKGTYFFTEDTEGLSSAKLKAVMKERDETYYGSRMHFIRALWANELNKNYFSIYATPKGIIDYDKAYKLEGSNMLWFNDIVQAADGQKFIMLGKVIEANDKKYNNKEMYFTYNNGNNSFMRQEDSDSGVLIDKNGYYDEGLEWKGNIGIYRIGRLLPFEFMPSAPDKLKK